MFSRERIKLSPGTYFIWGKKNKSTFWIALLFVIRSRLGHHNKVTVHCKQIILGPIKVRAGRSQWAVHACLSGIDCMRECKSTYYLWDRLQVLSRALTFLRHVKLQMEKESNCQIYAYLRVRCGRVALQTRHLWPSAAVGANVEAAGCAQRAKAKETKDGEYMHLWFIFIYCMQSSSLPLALIWLFLDFFGGGGFATMRCMLMT